MPVGLIAMAAYWISHGGFQGGLIEIDRAAPLTAEFRVDINTAPWPELTQLPNIIMQHLNVWHTTDHP